jgi:hypothetical protein
VNRLTAGLLCLAAVAACAASGTAGGRASEGELTATTKDWVFRAPASLGSQADLELNAAAVQICSDEIRKLVGHRPAPPDRFTWTWIISDDGPQFSQASRNGVLTSAHSDSRLVTDNSRAFREKLVRNRICYGPHEVTHVLTSDGWGTPWATEGLAQLTDYLFRSAEWRCCAAPQPQSFSCGETGYQEGPEFHLYADLSNFAVTIEMYDTAACFWVEVLDRGGLSAIRRALASIRADYPLTTGDLIVRNVSPAVGVDLRPIARRYGFDDDDLSARDHPLAPATPECRAGTTRDGDVRVGTIRRDKIHGTRGNDFLCGLAGNDRITGGAGTDVLQSGAGADVILTRDGRRDLVYCGTGRDTVRADRGDRVARTCEKVKRSRE